MFGNYYQTLFSGKRDTKMDLFDHSRFLYPDEVFFIHQYIIYNDSNLGIAYWERLNLGIEYYYTIRQQITSILGLWNAIIDEKRRYDIVDWYMESRDFIDGFLLCLYIIYGAYKFHQLKMGNKKQSQSVYYQKRLSGSYVF